MQSKTFSRLKQPWVPDIEGPVRGGHALAPGWSLYHPQELSEVSEGADARQKMSVIILFILKDMRSHYNLLTFIKSHVYSRQCVFIKISYVLSN